MSVLAKLIIDNKEVNVLSFNLGFNQQADTNGRPTGNPLFNGLNLVIESRRDLHLADWSFASDQRKQLELHIYPRVLGTKTRKLFFYDCHLVGWRNHFSAIGKQPMTETLKITCGGVKDSSSDGEYSAHWRTTYTSNTTPMAREEETEPKVVDYFITDLEGNKNPEYKVGDYIYVVAETENMVGKTLTINLADKTKDFKYEEELLVNDMLENYSIKSNTEKIKLEVVKQKKSS